MARGLGLTLGMIDALETERSLRASLEQRQRLLEVLLEIQRSISHRAPLPEILAAVTGGASTLLGDAPVSLVLDDALDPERPIVCLDPQRTRRRRRARASALEAPVARQRQRGGRARRDGARRRGRSASCSPPSPRRRAWR